MKILWFGDAADTGFGTVTWNVALRLIAQGVDLRLISQNVSIDPIPHPLGERTWDVGRIGPYLPQIMASGFDDGWKPDAAFILGDYAAARADVLNHPRLTQAFSSVTTYHYCPVEGIELPPRWNDLWRVVHPVAMSNFGAAEIAKVTGSMPPMIYHGVSTDDFYPVAPNRPGFWGPDRKPVTSKDGAKRALNYPVDRIMVLRTDRHMPRKRYNSLLRAMTRVFAATDNVDLVIHCRPHDQGGDLRDAVSKLPTEFQGRVVFTNAHDTFKGLPRHMLNVLYNAADIYASTSAEGFGLTIAEAIAAGVPAVALDYSAVTEVVGPAGILVPPQGLVDNEYDHFWAAVDEEKFAEAIIRLAAKPALRRDLGSRGPKHVAANFSWDTAAAQFAALVEPQSQEMAA